MPSVLKNVLRFTGLVVGVPVAQAHGLNLNGQATKPNNVWANGGGFTVAADNTNVTVTRLDTGGASVDVAVELWHSLENAQPLPSGIPTNLLPFIMQSGSGAAIADPTLLSALNGDVVPLIVGAAVIIQAGQFVRADADSLATANVIGLVAIGAAPGAIAVVRLLGALTLTTAQWDVITGQVGGLTQDAGYFLSVTAGQLSTTAPQDPGQALTVVGRAITSTVMLVETEPPVEL